MEAHYMKKSNEILCFYRKCRHLTQETLAERVRVSRSMIAQIERGKREPSRGLLLRLCEALHLDNTERALLFVVYGRCFQEPQMILPCIFALIRFDPALSNEQAEALIAELFQSYQKKRAYTTQERIENKGP